MKETKVNILGTDYKILLDVPDSEMPHNSDGCMDQSIKVIKIAHFDEPDKNSLQDNKSYENKVLRHEIIHAFLYESGLWTNSNSADSWATSEEMTDWIAIQYPKISMIFKELECEQ